MWNEGGSLEGRDPGITVPLLVTKTPFQAHSPELSKEWCMIKMTQTFHHPSGSVSQKIIWAYVCYFVRNVAIKVDTCTFCYSPPGQLNCI